MITPEEIRKKRLAKDLTQIAAARAAEVSVSAWRLWELGGVNPTPENEEKIRMVLGGDAV